LHDLASIGDDRVDSRNDTIDHDVEQQAWLGRRRPAEYPCSTHFTGSVVEGGVTVAALPAL
jgi:hypothetical protein